MHLRMPLIKCNSDSGWLADVFFVSVRSAEAPNEIRQLGYCVSWLYNQAQTNNIRKCVYAISCSPINATELHNINHQYVENHNP